MSNDIQFCPQDLKLIKATIGATGLIPMLYAPEILSGTKCHNCGDLGYLQVSILDPDGNGNPRTFRNGRWYTIKDNLAFDCPVCKADHSGRIKLMLESCGVPEHEWDWSVNKIQGMQGKTQAHRAACQLCSEMPMPSGLYAFYGDYGTGKSGLLKSVTVSAVKAGVYAWYINAREILQEVTATFKDGSKITERDIFDRYSSAKLLAIDEVDVIGNSEWAQSTMRTLLDKRYETRSYTATLIATNTRPDKLWPYLESRLKDGCVIPMGGQSLRGEEQEKWYQKD